MELPDLVTLPAITKFIERCVVDTIPAGAAPKDVTIQLPDADGAKVPARYTGFPPGLAVSDVVSVRATPQDTIKYVINGTSGATANKSGWPFANIITVSTTDPDADESDLATAVSNASASDVLWLDAETFTLAAKLTIDKELTILGDNPENTTITYSSDDTISITADDVTLVGLTIENNDTASAKECVVSSNDRLTLRNCIISRGGAGTPLEAYAILNFGGADWIFDNVRVTNTVSATFSRGYNAAIAASSVIIVGGSYTAPLAGVTIGRTNATVTIQGQPIIDGVVADNHIITTNVSGATVVFGDVGFLDEAGDFDTTTTEGDNVAWCVALTESINNAAIVVKRRNDAIVNYTGTAPNAGDFLITSTVAGLALASATMRPEIFAVATAGGSGGTVAVQLLTNTVFVAATNSNNILNVNSSNDSVFTGTISSKSGSDIVYTISTGNENSIKPASSSELGKIVLHNTTRGDSALISSVDTGTNTITLTDTVPAAWAATDLIQTNSLTNTLTISGTAKFFDVQITSGIPVLTRSIAVALSFTDSGGTGELGLIHPFETGAVSKFTGVSSLVNSLFIVTQPLQSLIDATFTVDWTASGAATASIFFRLRGYFLAVP